MNPVSLHDCINFAVRDIMEELACDKLQPEVTANIKTQLSEVLCGAVQLTINAKTNNRVRPCDRNSFLNTKDKNQMKDAMVAIEQCRLDVLESVRSRIETLVRLGII